MDLCWLVFFPGRPSAGDWRREDAASRIANAALTHNSDCYIFFEDRTCIMLEPQLLQEWNGTEAMYRELSRAVVADNRIVGARFLNERVGLEEALHGLLARVLVDVQVVLDFREAGHMALGGFETRAMGAGTKALCVIGGVRDVRERETEVLTALCARLNVGMLKVSLGERPELTSKCIKAVGEMNRGGYFSKAVAHLLQDCGSRPVQHTRTRLHLIVLIPAGTSLREFLGQPWTATILVDAFVSSHGIYSNTWLSFRSTTGEALTITSPGGQCLRAADAISFLQDKLEHSRAQRTLEELICAPSIRGQPPQRVLVADETRPVLQPSNEALAREARAVPVTVIFTHAAHAEHALAACQASGVNFHHWAAMGGFSSGLAYANVLHSSGLLAPALAVPLSSRRLAPKAQPSCPTVSLSSRLPPNQRPKGAPKLAPWATSQSEEVASTSKAASSASQGEALDPAPTSDPSDTEPTIDAASSGER
ncbi:unnamed protein product [Effrenium voratum]|nr:unnamed protein product [Effrenium voratum]